MGGRGPAGSRMAGGVRAVPVVAAAALLLGGCRADVGGPGAASSPGGGAASATGAAGGGAPGAFGVSPLTNPDGTKRGLQPLTSASEETAARRLIGQVATKGRGPRTGYSRDQFGYAWMDSASGVPDAHNGCDTRVISMVQGLAAAFSQLMRGVACYA
jgi:hypothetical protein